MKSNAFTFQAKYADALKGLPEEAQAEFALAIINYGCYGEEPCFKTPYLYALFTLAREDIDYSVKSRANGSKGGSKSSKAKAETPSEQSGTPLAETDNPPCEVSQPPLDGCDNPHCEVSATPLVEGSQPPLDENGNPIHSIAIHSIAIHSKAKHSSTEQVGSSRMARPSASEVEAFMAGYAAEKGISLSAARIRDEAESFVDFYASKGWKVGKAPMKDWQAAARRWIRDKGGQGMKGGGDADFSRFG